MSIMSGPLDPRAGGEPWHDRALRRRRSRREGGASATASPPTAMTRGWPTSSRSSPTSIRRRWTPRISPTNSFVDRKTDMCIIPPNSFCAGADGGIFPGAARRAGDLPRQVHLCALRHHRERDAAGARLGRPCHAGILQHHAAAGQHLCQRGGVPVPASCRAARPCEVSYADRAGKYMGQRGVTLPKL